MRRHLLDTFEEGLLSLLLVFMTLLVFIEIIARFVFNYGISWAEELTLIVNSWLVLLGASYCIREKAHIGITLLTEKLNKKAARFITAIALLFCLIYAGIFLYGSAAYVWEDYQIDIDLDDLPIPTWIPASVLVLGFSLIAIRFLQALYHLVVHHDLSVLQHQGEAESSMALADKLAPNSADDNPTQLKTK